MSRRRAYRSVRTSSAHSVGASQYGWRGANTEMAPAGDIQTPPPAYKRGGTGRSIGRTRSHISRQTAQLRPPTLTPSAPRISRVELSTASRTACSMIVTRESGGRVPSCGENFPARTRPVPFPKPRIRIGEIPIGERPRPPGPLVGTGLEYLRWPGPALDRLPLLRHGSCSLSYSRS